MVTWIYSQSRHPSFWVGTPQVPGGKPRVMISDDFGNLIDVNRSQATFSLA
jgi:hypothetical protein